MYPRRHIIQYAKYYSPNYKFELKNNNVCLCFLMYTQGIKRMMLTNEHVRGGLTHAPTGHATNAPTCPALGTRHLHDPDKNTSVILDY